jgi:hypothetical protein
LHLNQRKSFRWFNFHKKKDTHIQNDVINELRCDQGINSDELTATSNEGIVTLRGSVPHYSEKEKADEAAQRVGGVRLTYMNPQTLLQVVSHQPRS